MLLCIAPKEHAPPNVLLFGFSNLATLVMAKHMIIVPIHFDWEMFFAKNKRNCFKNLVAGVAAS